MNILPILSIFQCWGVGVGGKSDFNENLGVDLSFSLQLWVCQQSDYAQSRWLFLFMMSWNKHLVDYVVHQLRIMRLQEICVARKKNDCAPLEQGVRIAYDLKVKGT